MIGYHPDYLRRVAEVLDGWKNGSTLADLEKLAEDPKYVVWAPQIYQAATNYFRSDEFKGMLGKVERLGEDFLGDVLAGHDYRLVNSIMKEIWSEGKGLKIVVDDQEELGYTGSTHNLSIKDFLVPYHVRHNNIHQELERDDTLNLAKAITFSLPLNKEIFADLQVDRNESGCYLWLSSTWMKSLKS